MSSRRLNREDELTLGLTVNLKFNKSKRLSITNRCLGNEPALLPGPRECRKSSLCVMLERRNDLIQKESLDAI